GLEFRRVLFRSGGARAAAVAQIGVFARVGAGQRGAGAAGLVGNLVVEFVVEISDVEVVPAMGLPVHRQFTAGAGLRLQVRVAVQGRGALATEAGDALIELGGLGRLETGAHAALDGPVAVEGVHARSE